MMRSLRYVITGLLLSCFTTTAWAVEQVSLNEALAASLRERPMVQAGAAEVAAAEAGVRVSSSRYLPRLSLSERFMRTDEPGGSLFASLNQKRFELSPDASDYNDPPARSNFETRLTLSQPLYDPDLRFERDRASLGMDAAKAAQDRHREEAALETLVAYLAVQQGHARLGWAEQSLTETEELVAMTRTREQNGVGLRADTLRSEVLRNESRRQLLAAGNALKSAQRRLALAIGRDEGLVDIVDPVAIDAIELPTVEGDNTRGDLVAMAKAVAGAELAAQQQKAAYLPRLDLQAAYIRNDHDLGFSDRADAWSVSAGFAWLLFDGGERASALAAARARHLALDLQRQEQVRQARLAVAEAWQQLEEADLQLELVKSSLAAAEASRGLLSQRYAAGLATLSDLLAVQTELARARSDLAAAETGLLTARATVHYEKGSLLQALHTESETRP